MQKDDLILLLNKKYNDLTNLIDSLDEEFKHIDFIIHDRDKNLSNILFHLYHWHQMFISWYLEGKDNSMVKTPSERYSWRELKSLNAEIKSLYLNKSFDDAYLSIKKSHQDLLNLLVNISDEELNTPGYYKWLQKGKLITYFRANGSSHYNWAEKLIKTSYKAYMKEKKM